MTEAPPALAVRPQFTAEYWTKVPRQTVKAHIQRVTNITVQGEDWVEIVLKEGAAFRRPKADIQQLLTANLEVDVETLNKELVTGLFVPNCGWAFRMTAEDLAEYTKELSIAQHNRQRAAMEQTALAFSAVISQYLIELGATQDEAQGPIVTFPEPVSLDTLNMAKAVMSAMSQIVAQEQQ